MKLFCTLLLLLPLTSFAVDGVLEVNQACIETGCFGGDAPGLPVTLANPGSYRLTSNVDVSGYSTPQDRGAIEISGSNVTLDLNGFSILGPTTCSGSPTTACTPTGSGYGIIISGVARGAAISNGFIHGMGGTGLYCAFDCRVSHVVATNNGGHGIFSSAQAIITGSTASRNLKNGFSITGLVSDSLAIGNGQTGMVCADCSVTNSMITSNGYSGISFTGNSTFGGNLIRANLPNDKIGTALATAPNLCGSVACL